MLEKYQSLPLVVLCVSLVAACHGREAGSSNEATVSPSQAAANDQYQVAVTCLRNIHGLVNMAAKSGSVSLYRKAVAGQTRLEDVLFEKAKIANIDESQFGSDLIATDAPEEADGATITMCDHRYGFKPL